MGNTPNKHASGRIYTMIAFLGYVVFSHAGHCPEGRRIHCSDVEEARSRTLQPWNRCRPAGVGHSGNG